MIHDLFHDSLRPILRAASLAPSHSAGIAHAVPFCRLRSCLLHPALAHSCHEIFINCIQNIMIHDLFHDSLRPILRSASLTPSHSAGIAHAVPFCRHRSCRPILRSLIHAMTSETRMFINCIQNIMIHDLFHDSFHNSLRPILRSAHIV